jgi:hypothetical protein
MVNKYSEMSTVHDYESQAIAGIRISSYLPETYSGTSIVQWHGKIERQLVNMLGDAEKGRNFTYADKVREFLKIWRSNEINGSINRETLETLKSAADMLSVDTWNLASYFSSLRDQLRVLVASEEELPRGVDTNQNDPFAGGGGGGGGGAPPMSPAFGPEEDKPPGAEGDMPPGTEGEGEVPPPGNEGGEPGGAEGASPDEAGVPDGQNPGDMPGKGDERRRTERI